ncbi:hypothetical protein BUALT_Bualt18G0133500 [Buddleja alternifolia]|uniref:Transcription termination factor MTEF18, mitochondrial n=1 Tax=Buddleja alternifolia TaxID=168488 RepID=A0AAV6W3C2_9LAMI|nr:hypothetical protein BUALT_Bualt18G0133500 [Buddleja alternifolia]
MIFQFHNTFFLYPTAVSENNSTLLHNPPFPFPFPHACSKIQFLHRLAAPHNNNNNRNKLSITKSAPHTPISSLSVDGIPRLAKTDAQAALFDYLHCTRGLSFLDSEHISKNSPQFLAYLIAKVEKEQDVSRALSKFFRYHPINEFEPFFESLGLSPKEFASFLPRGLIFLCDDQLLLDNYHTLTDYGIPRIEIGKMYKEVNEIFRYEPGVLDRKLRAYEQVGMSRSAVIKLVSSSPLLLAGEVNNAFIGVLQRLKELGFENDWVGGYLSSKNTYNWSRTFDTLCFLREVGYSDEQMVVLLRTDISLLFEGSGKQVYVVVGALLKLGLKMNEVYALFLKNPQILSRKSAKNFWKALHFFFEVGLGPENIAKILSSHMELLASHSLKGPNTVLKNFNGDKNSLCQTIENDPSKFFNLALKSNIRNAEHLAARNPNNILEKTEFLLRIGYVENSDEMVKALKRFRGRGDQLQERFDCLVQVGLDFNAVSSMVKQAPTVLNQTKDILKKKIECLQDYLGYPVDSIVGFPSYLCYDMERISLRFSMYAWLREKGASKPMLSVSTLLACSDARFVKYFVSIHPEGPAMWEKLKNSLPSS